MRQVRIAQKQHEQRLTVVLKVAAQFYRMSTELLPLLALVRVAQATAGAEERQGLTSPVADDAIAVVRYMAPVDQTLHLIDVGLLLELVVAPMREAVEVQVSANRDRAIGRRNEPQTSLGRAEDAEVRNARHGPDEINPTAAT